MNQTLDKKSIFRKYLLQELEQAEQEQVENRLLTDKEFSIQIAIAQDDLIDDFVAGLLSEQEMESFRTGFLTTPARLEKLKFAMTLNRYATDKPLPAQAGTFARVLASLRGHPFKVALTVAASLFLLGAALFVVLRLGWFQPGHDQDFRRELARINRAQETGTSPFSELQQNSATTRVLMLRQNLVREGGDDRRVELTSSVTLVQMLLEVAPGPYDKYSAVMQTADGKDIAPVEDLKGRNNADGARFVLINIPGRFLKRGDYQFRLVGIAKDGSVADLGLYPFSVITR